MSSVPGESKPWWSSGEAVEDDIYGMMMMMMMEMGQGATRGRSMEFGNRFYYNFLHSYNMPVRIRRKKEREKKKKIRV